MSHRNWCDTCRGDVEGSEVLLRCTSCPRRFHMECAGLRSDPGRGWMCPYCEADDEDEQPSSKEQKSEKAKLKKRIAAVRKCHTECKDRSRSFLTQKKSHLKPFCSSKFVKSLKQQTKPASASRIVIKKKPAFVHATLRSYQVTGVNWLLSRYSQLGTGCIVADEMGLGKTIQSLAFLAALQHHGVPGPHLVVTPFAVLQNWANEMKRFTPCLTHVKIHGSVSERDRLMSRDDVVRGEFDVYLTTYDTFLSEEAFFTESFLFNTVIIDEGHRLKNASCKLCKGLARLNSPFRVLLTGTPLQNCLAELLALMSYILPSVPIHDDLVIKTNTPGSNNETKVLDRLLISQASTLLETSMIRRIKSEVEASLLPKIEYVLKPPPTRLQRKWYRSFLESTNSDHDRASMGLLTKTQLMHKVLQLGKVANHPKALALTYDRERAKAACIAKRAEGSMFIKLGTEDVPRTQQALANETELRGLVGEKLINSGGKLALLDRLLLRKKREGSRVLIFTQFTLTLDILEEYVKYRFGQRGVAYLRLEGNTGRIQREMDMRSFNKPKCGIFCYLISTRAGGQGINLATADTVVLYDTCWNPQVDLQAQDRAHRIGQTKQVKVYRLITENTVEERVLARARQKMVLDALIIKKRGNKDEVGLAELEDDEGEGKEEIAKLSVDELWNMLSEGVSKVFDSVASQSEDWVAKDYDRLIDEAKPAKWDDKTGGDDKPSIVESSELEGTIFAPKRKRGRPSKTECDEDTWNTDDSLPLRKVQSKTSKIKPSKVIYCVDLLSSDDETFNGPEIVESSVSSESTPDSPNTPDYTVTPRRNKRTRTAPRNFVANMFDTSQKLKRKKICHDFRCFRCRETLPKILDPKNDKTPEKSDNAPSETPNTRPRRICRTITPSKTVTPKKAIPSNEPLRCMVCPRVYHFKCSGDRHRPKTRQWYCPWHKCVTCKRKASNVGGTLFHCVSCPLTYCFDCSPDEHTEGGQSTSKAALALTASLERKGMASLKSYLFFTCGQCKIRASNETGAFCAAPLAQKTINIDVT